ncbi:hypothetical protein [Rhodopirellula bahusiensis]|uniref:hypothetical protein n=1 Tax=Rhodopirellula bahusiensis TaxID=2014065 RepID=UPI0013042AB2|nr:hypothetical protein [Rhodopirellula bahusiensis]
MQAPILRLAVLLVALSTLAGCGGSGDGTTYLPVEPPTEEERAAADAYTKQMTERPGN